MLRAPGAVLASGIDGGVAVRGALRPRQSQDAAAIPALVLAAIALVLSLTFALTACTPKSAADIAGIACKLVPVFDKTSTGALVGAFCADVAHLVSDALAEQSASLTAPAQCDSLVEVRSGDRLVGLACPAYAALAKKSVVP